MKGLSEYGAVATKIRGMRAHLLTIEEYTRLANASSVKEIVQFLKGHPGYAKALRDVDPENMRRQVVERLLNYSEVRDLAKICLFLKKDQKDFVTVYFTNYEIQFFNNVLREIYNKHVEATDLTIYRNMFHPHSRFKFEDVVAAKNIDEFVEALKDSIYYDTLNRIRTQSENPTLFDFEMGLQMFYFSNYWAQLKKYHSRYDQEIIRKTHGTEIDMLNLIWIYRSKAYYKVPNKYIHSFLIPSYYKLKQRQIIEMVECETIEEVLQIMRTTYYKKYFAEGGIKSLESAYAAVLSKQNNSNRRKYPYSIAVVESFAFSKRTEIENIVSICESVRYGHDAKTIMENLNLGGIG